MQGWLEGSYRAQLPIDDLIAAIQCTKRREILAALALSPLTVGGVQKLLGYAYSDVSKHLSELRGCGLVQFEPRKKEHIQRLTSAMAVRFEPDSLCLEIKTESPKRLLVLTHELHTSALQFIAGNGISRVAPAGRGPIVATTRSRR